MRVHFWGVALGIVLMYLSLTLGGLVQGLEMNQASESLSKLVEQHGYIEGLRRFVAGFKMQNGAVPFLEIVQGTLPWLKLRTVSGVLILIGHTAFAILMVMNVHAWGRAHMGPTLFAEDTAEYARLLREARADIKSVPAPRPAD